MIESAWRKLFDRIRAGSVTQEDEAVIQQAIAQVYPGRDYVLINGDVFDLRFTDGEAYTPEDILEAIKPLEYVPTANRPSTKELIDAIYRDIKNNTLNTDGDFYKALDPYLD